MVTPAGSSSTAFENFLQSQKDSKPPPNSGHEKVKKAVLGAFPDTTPPTTHQDPHLHMEPGSYGEN